LSALRQCNTQAAFVSFCEVWFWSLALYHVKDNVALCHVVRLHERGLAV
jgi:hypothetical protein